MGVLDNLEPHTKYLLDAISDDDIMIYMYNNKLISHQAVKKYFGIKDICELPDMSYWTKIDLEDDRIVTVKEAEELVNDLDMNYFIESSAKTGFNAEKIFVQAAKLLYTEFKEIAKTQKENKVINKKLENINNINNIVKNKKKCC